MRTEKVYKRIASLLHSIENCRMTNNQEWLERFTDQLDSIIDNNLPHGSGFDQGTKLDYDRSHAEKFYLIAPFHHMDSNGYYCGWSDHVVTVSPSLAFDFNLKISNPDRSKQWDMDYFYDTFNYCLNCEVEF